MTERAGRGAGATEAGGLTAGTARLRERVRREAGPFLERPVLLAEAFRASEGEPWHNVRWAEATAHLLASCRLTILPEERLVGAYPSSTASPDFAAIDAANDYLYSQNCGLVTPTGHIALDYPGVLAWGLDRVTADVRHKRRTVRLLDPRRPEKLAYYEAADIALTGLRNFIDRHARLATELAETESDPERRSELAEIARICAQVAHGPARTFREALQLSWFCLLATVLELGPSHESVSPGRADQYLWPCYAAEQSAGSLDEALVDDLLDQWLVKLNQFSHGRSRLMTVCVGGRRPDGVDASNELSFRLLRSSARTRMHMPGLALLWHAELPDELLLEGCRLLGNGNAQPAFFNHDLIIEGLQRHGVPFEHAVDHLPGGCGGTSIAGRSGTWVAEAAVNLPVSLLCAMFGGKDPRSGDVVGQATPVPKGWNALLDALDAQLAHAAHRAVAAGIEVQSLAARLRPLPLLSCFIQGCLQRGIDVSQGGALYNFLEPEAVGLANVVNSLAAIRSLVYDGRRCTLEELRQALSDNWNGHELLRESIRRTAPRFGRDDPQVNGLFAYVAGSWCDHLEGCRNYFGGPVLPGFLGWQAWTELGRETPATPDGRLDCEPFADNLGALCSLDGDEVEQLVLSASGLDLTRILGGIGASIRLPDGALRTPEGPVRLKGKILRAFAELDAFMLEVDLTAAAELRAARHEPDADQPVMIRVGGCAVPFGDLPPDAQDTIIARQEG